MEKESSPGRVLSKLMSERKTAIRLNEDEVAKHTPNDADKWDVELHRIAGIGRKRNGMVCNTDCFGKGSCCQAGV